MYEETRATLPECMVYRVPPRSRADGYKAADWELDKAIWQGKAVVRSRGSVCSVRLEDAEGKLFAVCQWDQLSGAPAVEKVLDSSRYFVLRIEHQGRHAYIGLGFNERSAAFDFNVAITDHKRDLDREAEVARLKQQVANEPQLDFSLKEGEKIKINVQARAASSPGVGDGDQPAKSTRRKAAGPQVTSLGGGLLAPPPSAKTSIHRGGPAGNSSSGGDLFGSGAFAPAPQQFQPQQQPVQQQQQQQFLFGAPPPAQAYAPAAVGNNNNNNANAAPANNLSGMNWFA